MTTIELCQFARNQAEHWNLNHSLGTPVIVAMPNGKKHRGVTTSEASVMGAFTPIIRVSCVPMAVMLDQVQPEYQS